MSESKNEREELLSELKSFLEQSRQVGLEWYLDSGPIAADSALAGDAGATLDAPPPLDTGPPAQADQPSAHIDKPLAQTDQPPARQDRPSGQGSSGAFAPAATAPQPSGRIDPANRYSKRAAAPTSKRATGKKDFEVECAAFVAETLEKIQGTSATVPKQTDIFTPAAADEPPSMAPEQKAAALDELAREVAPCTACKLHEGRTQTVFGVGNPDADLVFIGEAPGRDEDLQGEPFVGRAGKLLTEILKAIGFARDDVYICNILKCRPPQNRDPERDEVDACEPYLRRQLEILDPKVICCLGRVAAQNLLDTRATLGALRQTVHFYEGIPVMATYHPAALLRNPNWKKPTWDDVRKLKALCEALKAE